MQKRKLLINAIMSMIQTIVLAGILFILYRFLLSTIGVEYLGIWSLILAATSLAQIATFGLSGSVVKFIAKYITREENENVSGVIQTAAISVAVFVGFILLIGYPIAKWVLGLVIPSESFLLAIGILPYSLFSLWLMMIASIFQSALDGYQRIDLRSFLLMGGAIIHLFLCFILTPKYGLIGLAYAHIIQNFIIMLSSWLLLKRLIPLLPIIPYKWNKSIFKEIIGYAINFQIISVTVMFYDPITKALLSKFGGLSMVGYYEMASKMIQQFRALIVSANQVLVPAIAGLKEKIAERIQSVYLTSYQLVFYLALPLYTLIIVSTPLISKIWIGRYDENFMVFGILLSIAWFFNNLTVPAYFTFLGIGEIKWNLLSHILIALLNIGLGFLLGHFFDGLGVVIGWVASLIMGSSIITLMYHIVNKISFLQLFPKENKWLLFTCSIAILLTIIIQLKINYSPNMFLINVIVVSVLITIVFIPSWQHPMRKKLLTWIKNGLLVKNYKN